MERNYIVVCNRHKGIAGSLLFWGYKSKDEEKRCYGGYTSDLNGCERYTLDELEESNYKFPVYGVDFKPKMWRRVDDFIININQLEELGYKPMLIYYR